MNAIVKKHFFLPNTLLFHSCLGEAKLVRATPLIVKEAEKDGWCKIVASRRFFFLYVWWVFPSGGMFDMFDIWWRETKTTLEWEKELLKVLEYKKVQIVMAKNIWSRFHNVNYYQLPIAEKINLWEEVYKLPQNSFTTDIPEKKIIRRMMLN